MYLSTHTHTHSHTLTQPHTVTHEVVHLVHETQRFLRRRLVACLAGPRPLRVCLLIDGDELRPPPARWLAAAARKGLGDRAAAVPRAGASDNRLVQADIWGLVRPGALWALRVVGQCGRLGVWARAAGGVGGPFDGLGTLPGRGRGPGESESSRLQLGEPRPESRSGGGSPWACVFVETVCACLGVRVSRGCDWRVLGLGRGRPLSTARDQIRGLLSFSRHPPPGVQARVGKRMGRVLIDRAAAANRSSRLA